MRYDYNKKRCNPKRHCHNSCDHLLWVFFLLLLSNCDEHHDKKDWCCDKDHFPKKDWCYKKEYYPKKEWCCGKEYYPKKDYYRDYYEDYREY